MDVLPLETQDGCDLLDPKERGTGFMADLTRKQVQAYLEYVLCEPVIVHNLTVLGRDREAGDIKGFGYGVPVKVEFQVKEEGRTAVLHTLSPGPFGHEHMADRAQEMLWQHRAYNKLPRHVRSLDVCGFRPGNALLSLGTVNEFGLLTQYADGHVYASDLERIRDTGRCSAADIARSDALCDYLAEIHRVPGTDPGLYVRRIRELIGHGQCIMGIVDSYPAHPLAPARLLKNIERLCLEWRWKLKGRTHRLRQVHGDFHPWNILFRPGIDFSVLDRSRGEYGDPADDVTSLTLNFVFFSLQRSGRLEGDFERLFCRFWQRYLERSGDAEILQVAAPFFAFRGLVMASPVWYPAIPDLVRQKLLNFVVSVLEAGCFNPRKVNYYLGL
ncbi:MAG TPA: phosphotransferase [Bryobacteraceae bacterium]|nr:phosphotransferase [Bryobacteraceae bacterium]